MNSFFKPHIGMLVSEGHQVDIACNANGLPLDGLYNDLNCHFYQVDFSRSALSLDNVKAYRQLKKIVENGKYDVVHCHTPIASVITRLVCREFRRTDNLKVFYTAHGFHFYKGAPLKNWMLYYPAEKYCSLFTDKLITINQEDYTLARRKFKAREVFYVPGVGVDLSRFQGVHVDRKAKRQELGVPMDCFLMLSVGELNKNKNHQIIIRAMAQLGNSNIHYAIAGVGDQKEHLHRLAETLGVSKQVHLLGYRTDVVQLCKVANVFCFPSIREGLGLAAIEAMACGLPVIAADNRGTRSFISNHKNGFLCDAGCADQFAQAVKSVLEADVSAMGINNVEAAQKFSIDNVLAAMSEIYGKT